MHSIHKAQAEQPIATDGVAWSVFLLVTFVGPAKTAEPIEMPFGVLTWVVPKNHVFDGGRHRLTERGNLGVVRPTGVSAAALCAEKNQ